MPSSGISSWEPWGLTIGVSTVLILFLSKYNDFTNSFKIYKKKVINHFFPIVSEDFNIFLELPLKTISRGFKYEIMPIKYYNRTIGTAKFKIKELGSRYLFTLLYCFIEKVLLNKKKWKHLYKIGNYFWQIFLKYSFRKMFF